MSAHLDSSKLQKFVSFKRRLSLSLNSSYLVCKTNLTLWPFQLKPKRLHLDRTLITEWPDSISRKVKPNLVTLQRSTGVKISFEICRFFETLAVNNFTFAALHSADKFSNVQQISELKINLNCILYGQRGLMVTLSRWWKKATMGLSELYFSIPS